MNNKLLVTKFTPVFHVLSPQFFVPCSECITKWARSILELEMLNLHMLICVIPLLGMIITMIIALGIEHIFHYLGFIMGFKSIICGGFGHASLPSAGTLL